MGKIHIFKFRYTLYCVTIQYLCLQIQYLKSVSSTLYCFQKSMTNCSCFESTSPILWPSAHARRCNTCRDVTELQKFRCSCWGGGFWRLLSPISKPLQVHCQHLSRSPQRLQEWWSHRLWKLPAPSQVKKLLLTSESSKARPIHTAGEIILKMNIWWSAWFFISAGGWLFFLRLGSLLAYTGWEMAQNGLKKIPYTISSCFKKYFLHQVT